MDKHIKLLRIISRYTAILAVGLSILTACQNQRISSPALSKVVELNATGTPVQSVLPRATPTPTPTPNYTPAASPTSTITPVTLIPTLTKIPLPTLNPNDAQAYVLDLLEDNAGCLFPCWWGIVPGETSWGDALSSLTPFAQKIQLSPIGWFHFLVPEAKNTLQQHYSVHYDRIDMIEVHFGKIPAYTLSDLLSTYGPPDEVRIRTFSTQYQGIVPFYLVLFYSDQGFLALFEESNDAMLIGDKVRKCFQQDNVSDLALWAPGQDLTFEQATSQTSNIYFNDGFPLLPLEEATELDIYSFYEEFSNPGTSKCLETPTDLWPGQFQ